jgi:glucarate dehydratase
MRVVKVEATPVTMTTTRSNATSRGSGRSFSRTIVRVESDSGLIGWGEAPRGDSSVLINKRFGPRAIGLHPAEWQKLRQVCLPPRRDWGLIDESVDYFAYSGLEVALWDLWGKEVGLPIYRLLGGGLRPKTPFAAYAYAVDRAEGYPTQDVPGIMAKIALDMIKETGSSLFEFKVGHQPVDCEIETIRAVRKALPSEVSIALDANMGYSEDQARRLLSALRDVEISNFEEPVATLDGMTRLRRDFGIPMSTHCTRIEALKSYPEIDGVVGDFHLEGGFVSLLMTASAVASLGQRFWFHTYQELGVSWAARCHLGMACAQADRPGQALIPWVENDLILGDDFRIRAGGVCPPDRPGLGVEIDMEAFKEAAEVYSKHGEQAYLVSLR